MNGVKERQVNRNNLSIKQSINKKGIKSQFISIMKWFNKIESQ